MEFTTPAPQAKEKVQLTGVEKTMLMTTFLKYHDAKSASPILGDPSAEQLLSGCDLGPVEDGFGSLSDKRYVQQIVGRTKRIDDWCQDFLDTHARAGTPVTVLHVACGIDCRFLRVRKAAGAVRWIDLDLPPVVDLRKRLIPSPSEAENVDYTLRALSAGSEGWLNDTPADRPTLVILEGVLYYLEPELVIKIFRDVVAHFRKYSGEVLFDTVGPLSTRFSRYVLPLKPSGASWKWSIDNAPSEMSAIDPRLKMKDRVFWTDYMHSHPPFFGPVMSRLVALHPQWRRNLQYLRFEF
ncbi:S-adenosyl-L-methionine-dependent methyltransferase [Xylaria scruposa]|nr:S-adenosyl-L-methionine-dependent methyltransferase [Xylaria scruposa]